MVQQLLDPDRITAFDEANRIEQQRLREQHENRRSQPMLSIEAARRNREQVAFDELPVPAFQGVRAVSPSLAELRPMIDWTFFFLAWELKGKYPAILGDPAARELFDDATALLDEIIDEGLLTARGGYGFWPGHSRGGRHLGRAGRGDLPAGAHAQAADRQAGRASQPLPGRLRVAVR